MTTHPTTHPTTYRAVIFDLGGVVFPSPIDVFRAYEREHGVPERFLSEVVLTDPDGGAWARLERGELSVPEFCTEFEAECARAGHTIDATAVMNAVGEGFAPRPEMVAAITAIRAHGLKTGALTNNWVPDEPREGKINDLTGVFDVIVESAIEGVRKPDPRIYELACERLGVRPDESVFLDDLGVNLKAARALGMTTIKVADPAAALSELSEVLGFTLDGRK
ncbi:MAG: HAD-IA family hydrolase [Actinomycetota bacterium]